ncbi:hypothetical protein COU57_06205 [Candidatus Pacearchaeota archaeon CG10_big_fil_rev_8_21_14_0_10_32_14]|nr:MAG: hypothetical protein COU57_06205 [Candidatus Pacearchaeota archaeon CG10_big_fil_rev_8_21_14_0_10_32_14]
MEFKEGTPLYANEVVREGGEDILYFNFIGAPFVPDLVSDGRIMEMVIDALIENSNVSRIVFVQQKNYHYDFKETSYLIELAQLYTFFMRQENILSPNKLASVDQRTTSKRYNELFYISNLVKNDPLLAYYELQRVLIETKIMRDKVNYQEKNNYVHYIYLLEKIFAMISDTKLIKDLLPQTSEYNKGDREIYYQIFSSDVTPNYTFTRLEAHLPKDSNIIDQYKIKNGDYDESVVTIFMKEDEAKMRYHIIPPEYSLSEEHNLLLNLAKGVLVEHQPRAEEFTDTQRTRQVFFNISRDLVRDLAYSKNINLNFNELNKLATILVRHTVGFGLIEVLLQDKNLQDVVLNAPIPQTPIFVRHQEYGECSVNILPSQEDVDSWAAKFRMISGRPLDEANPILDTQLEIGNMSARIAIIQQPLSPDGLAYAIRRHRETPWTLPLFIQSKMITPFAAGLMSFLIDGNRTLLVAGTRSSGKTSLLGSLMLEIIPKYRIIVLEDTLELPVDAMRKLKYDILRMKVRSSLLHTTTEISADEGIRTSLRLGDSSLIVGEVRSLEAKALYEAMRVGALANVVAGTIHGASPYGIFDRVVNDLEVPATSFKATDIIMVANPIKSPDGLHSWKRVLQITEVRKHWKNDPEIEKGFVDLMKFNIEKDQLEPSDDLINGDSEVIKAIASNVKGWAGNWDAIYDNILLRGRIKEELLNVAIKTKKLDLLEAEFSTLSNNAFHRISDEVRKEIGLPMSERVFPEWQKWLNQKVKGKSL